jgi:hypothetical protein
VFQRELDEALALEALLGPDGLPQVSARSRSPLGKSPSATGPA